MNPGHPDDPHDHAAGYRYDATRDVQYQQCADHLLPEPPHGAGANLQSQLQSALRWRFHLAQPVQLQAYRPA